ncbi:MAG: hypothetical protein J6386_10965 [Candidatus Synoicihabitans palmerolidicus]|nr:hypothetical protein [Candidatus Synoicihabitans palmerolidicus]
MSWIEKCRDWFTAKDEEPGEAFSQMILAARKDEAFREEVLRLLSVPMVQRKSLIKSALHEMDRRREPGDVQAAFALLATDEGAAIAARALAED